MKKISKLLFCLAMISVVPLTGCFSSLYNRSGRNNLNNICSTCKEAENIEMLVDNIENVMDSINVVKGEYVITNTKNTYEIDFDIIADDKRKDWDVFAKTKADDKEITIYFKDSNLYILYPHNNANIIMKDNYKNVVKELEKTLDQFKAKYNKEKLYDMVTGDKLEGIDFDYIKNNASYKKNNDNTFTISYVENEDSWEFNISKNYLITEINCTSKNFNSSLKFTYPSDITITYPMGLDMLTSDIEEVKEILKVDSFAEIFDKDLKDN